MMDCKHGHMDYLPFTNQKHCTKCGKSELEINLERQLAAANVRIVELEAQVDFAKKALKGE